MIRILATTVILLASAGAVLVLGQDSEPGENVNDDSPEDVFKQRIMPIFKSPKPSSCVQCHLSGLDLKNYILPSHEKTFVSLRDQG